MSTQRFKCPKCNNEDPRMIKEVDDKTKVMYYSLAGQPVYRKNLACGRCGLIFEKPT